MELPDHWCLIKKSHHHEWPGCRGPCIQSWSAACQGSSLSASFEARPRTMSAVQWLLEEDDQWIHCIVEYQNKGPANACLCRPVFHRNLTYLAAIADASTVSPRKRVKSSSWWPFWRVTEQSPSLMEQRQDCYQHSSLEQEWGVWGSFSAVKKATNSPIFLV